MISKADSFIDSDSDSLSYPIYVIDQYPIGIFFINMFKLTGKGQYYNVASNLFRMLMERTDEEGNITYLADAPFHYSDELGMYVPFLMEWYILSGDIRAVEIVKHNVDFYKNNGTDINSGLPFHGFDPVTKQKLGSANWGRGIGWYALAMSYCPPSIFEDTRFDMTISQIDHTQFPGEYSHFDSSTALLLEIYKASRSQDSVSIDFIKPYIRKLGIVDSFSGDTFGFNDYSHLFGCSELGNGLLLMLVGRFPKRE